MAMYQFMGNEKEWNLTVKNLEPNSDFFFLTDERTYIVSNSSRKSLYRKGISKLGGHLI